MGYGGGNGGPRYNLVWRERGSTENLKRSDVGRDEMRDLAASMAPRVASREIDYVHVTNRFGVNVTVDFFGTTP
jgi:hypothetical protein